MNERLVLKARLADAEKRLNEMEIRADAYISIIREIIDPFAGEYTDIDVEKAVVILHDFRKLWKDAKALKEQKAILEKAVNG